MLIFRDGDWYLLCDDGFTDHAAALVCQELGFPYGYASCCSAEGPLSIPIWMNHTLDCASGTHVEECLRENVCTRRSYASVSCTYQPRTAVGKNGISLITSDPSFAIIIIGSAKIHVFI